MFLRSVFQVSEVTPLPVPSVDKAGNPTCGTPRVPPNGISFLLTLALLSVSNSLQAQQPDAFDPKADGSSLTVDTVYSIAVQTDGKVLLGGGFTSLGGQGRIGIGRVNADGTLDTSFNTNAWSSGNGAILAFIVQDDGKILVAGNFTILSGQPRTHIARLNADGSVDSGFNPTLSGTSSPTVSCLALQADGKILVGGNFTSMAGQPRSYIARLNADGTLDSDFQAGADQPVRRMAIQSDGKILVGGDFSSLNGQSRERLGRLQADGTLDTDFNPGADGAILSLVVQADGEILVAGNFASLGGQPRALIGRLYADGTLDSSFNPTPEYSVSPNNSLVNSLAVQADGRILVGGQFTTLNGQPRHRIGRLNADGTLDTSFAPGSASNPGTSAAVDCIALQADGKILLGGRFSTLGNFNRSRICRLNNNTPATQTLTVTNTTQVDWQRGGSAPEVDRVAFAIWNGTTWVNQSAPERVSGGWRATGLNLPSTTWIRARGYSSGERKSFLFEEIQTYGAGTFPMMKVLDPQGHTLTTGTAKVDYGEVNWLEDETKTFTIRNDSSSALIGLAVSLEGHDAADFTLNGPGVTTINPGQSRTFSATFRPRGGAFHGALLRIASNDLSAASFNVLLTGKGLHRDPDFNSSGVGSFNTLPSTPGYVHGMAVQADGKIVVGGYFPSFNAQTRLHLARLHPNGTLDTGFTSQPNDMVYCVSAQTNGKILVGGAFTSLAGTRQKIARLNANGTLDSSFNPGANGDVRCLALQADGKILVGGEFSVLGGESRPRIARLNEDGSLDADFNPGVNGIIYSMAVQPDGKILIGGTFSSVGGQLRSRIARLNANGSLDAGFNPSANDVVNCIVTQPDGRILTGGSFSTLNGQPRSRIGRLNSNGTLDASFSADVQLPTLPSSSTVLSFALQGDGKILLGGFFSLVNQQLRSNIARLQPDGSLDASFDPVATGRVAGIALQPDGKILAAGFFDSLGGQYRSRWGRLINNAPATQTLSVTGTSQIDWQVGGSSPEVEQVSFAIWSNNAWVDQCSPQRVSGVWQASNLSLPTSAWVRAQGHARGGFYSGSSSIVRQIQTYGTGSFPKITTVPDQSLSVNTATSPLPFSIDIPTELVDQLTLSGSSDDKSLVPDANIVFGGSGTSRTVTVTPGSGQFGNTIITIHASDGTRNSSVTFNLKVRTPQAIDFPAISSQLTTNTVVLAATGGESGNPVTFAVTNGPGVITGGNTLTFTGAGSVTVTASQAGNADYDAAAGVPRAIGVTKAPAGVSLSGLSQTYNGTPRSASASTTPAGLNVILTYNGSSTAPTQAGTYFVQATINNAMYQGTSSGSLVVAKSEQEIDFAAITSKVTTDAVVLFATGGGSGVPVAFAVTSGPGVIGGGNTLTFTAAGSVTVTASQAGNSNYHAAQPVSHSFAVTKALAVVTLDSLNQAPDGTPRAATVTTQPPGLAVTLTYDGSETPPTVAGSYAVLALVDDNPLYQGSANGTLVLDHRADREVEFPAEETEPEPAADIAWEAVLTGLYDGLLCDANDDRTLLGAIETLRVSAPRRGKLEGGAVSGRLRLPGLSMTFTGRFDVDGS